MKHPSFARLVFFLGGRISISKSAFDEEKLIKEIEALIRAIMIDLNSEMCITFLSSFKWQNNSYLLHINIFQLF